MTFTYHPSTVLGKVRLLLGDIDATAQEELRLEDEDMVALFELETGTTTPQGTAIYSAAVACGGALRAKFLRKAEGSPGPDRVQPTSRAQEIANLIAGYARKAMREGYVYAGGASRSDNAALASNTDRVGSFACIGMMDNK